MFGKPIGLGAYLCILLRLVKYQFTREAIDVYSCGIYHGMLDLDPFTPLDEVTQGLSR